MIEVDFSQIEDIGDYEPLPAGAYTCKLTDVEESQSSKGHNMWKVRFVVEQGEYAGRYIFDRLTFSPDAMRRVKLLCSCLDIEVDRKVQLTADMLLDGRCVVRIKEDEYTDPEGCARRGNSVLFAGFEPLSSDPNAHVPY